MNYFKKKIRKFSDSPWLGRKQKTVLCGLSVVFCVSFSLTIGLGIYYTNLSRTQSLSELADTYSLRIIRGFEENVVNTEVIARYATSDKPRFFLDDKFFRNFLSISEYLQKRVPGVLAYSVTAKIDHEDRSTFESYTSEFWQNHFNVPDRVWPIRGPVDESDTSKGWKSQDIREFYGVVTLRYPFRDYPDAITINIDQIWIPEVREVYTKTLEGGESTLSRRVKFLDRGYGMLVYSKASYELNNITYDGAIAGVFEFEVILDFVLSNLREEGVRVVLYDVTSLDNGEEYLYASHTPRGNEKTKTEKINENDPILSPRSQELNENRTMDIHGRRFKVVLIGGESYRPPEYLVYILICLGIFAFFVLSMVFYIAKSRQSYYHRIELERREKLAHNKLMGYICHELRNPVHSIGLLSEQIIPDQSDPDSESSLNQISSVSNHMYCLLNDFLDYSKIQATGIEVRNVEFNLTDVVRDCFNQMLVLNANKGTSMVLNISPETDFLKIRSDPTRIRQVLTNGLSNAIKYSHVGEITLSVNKTMDIHGDNKILIRISDEGEGLGDADPEELFEDYKQLKGAENVTKMASTGLGLGIARTLIRKMGGDLALRNRRDGKSGTEFVLWIPDNSEESENTVSINVDQGNKNQRSCEGKPVLIRSIHVVCSKENIHAFRVFNEKKVTSGKVSFSQMGDHLDPSGDIYDIESLLDYFREKCESEPAGLVAILEISDVVQKKYQKELRKVLKDVEKLGNKVAWVAYTGNESGKIGARKLRKVGFDGVLFKGSDLCSQMETIFEEFEVRSKAKGMVVWSCEDDPVINQLMGKILRENFHKDSRLFFDGLPLLKCWEDISKSGVVPDVILLDIVMKHSRGNEVCSRLRELGCTLPIIAVTGNSSEEDMRSYLSSGFDGILNKPCGVDALLTTVTRMVN